MPSIPHLIIVALASTTLSVAAEGGAPKTDGPGRPDHGEAVGKEHGPLRKEQEKHLKRLATIDRLAALAAEQGNAALAENAERMRAQELERHHRSLAKHSDAKHSDAKHGGRPDHAGPGHDHAKDMGDTKDKGEKKDKDKGEKKDRGGKQDEHTAPPKVPPAPGGEERPAGGDRPEGERLEHRGDRPEGGRPEPRPRDPARPAPPAIDGAGGDTATSSPKDKKPRNHEPRPHGAGAGE